MWSEANVSPSAVCPQHGTDLFSKRASIVTAAEASRGRSLTEGNNVSTQQVSGSKRVRNRHTRVLHIV